MLVNRRACQSLAGMLVGEKDRCVRISPHDARTAPFHGGYCELTGTIVGTVAFV
jgi:hypothetical protein